MIYILAILLPPLACFVIGRSFVGFLLLILMITLIGWPIASIIAVLTVMDARAERRTRS